MGLEKPCEQFFYSLTKRSLKGSYSISKGAALSPDPGDSPGHAGKYPWEIQAAAPVIPPHFARSLIPSVTGPLIPRVSLRVFVSHFDFDLDFSSISILVLMSISISHFISLRIVVSYFDFGCFLSFFPSLSVA